MLISFARPASFYIAKQANKANIENTIIALDNILHAVLIVV